MDEHNSYQQGQINIEIQEEVAGGVYSNLAVVNHSNSEFVLDFVQVMPGVPKARVRSRIILTPQHMKRLVKALQDNVMRFEQAFGEIEDQANQMPNVGMPFGPTGQA